MDYHVRETVGLRSRKRVWRGVLVGVVAAAALLGAGGSAMAAGDPAGMVSADKPGFEEIIFIKRQAYNGNHYYTEFINGQHRGGGNICVFNLKTKKVRDIVKGLPDGGVFRRVGPL